MLRSVTSMLSPRLARFAYLAVMLLAMSALAGVAMAVFRQARSTGTGETVMAVWLLAFVVALPMLMLLLPIARALQARLGRRRTVPMAGKEIPGAGQ